ncbi:MAG: 2,3-bisphosphoglycerate-independent phosphoglycerate mutase [Planctomycetota bacterium]|nr:2,3-bisphosphoglycerate-independent phosphoglycerate mutase [Planctomycetota bacterium]
MQRAALIILDGWGLAPPGPGNCIGLAQTPITDSLDARAPRTTLVTSGRAVGLPEGQMGNSEVGHLTLGAGRVLKQHLVRIGEAVESGELAQNEVLQQELQAAGRVHVIGLASDGGVHSHLSHMIALAQAAQAAGKPVFFHAFTDGRDVSRTSGVGFLRRLQETAPVASVVGRYYAMDRDQRWERAARAYELLVTGAGALVQDPVAAVMAFYDRDVTDEFIEPITTGAATLEDGDLVLFANFRADRARQLTEALSAPGFKGFKRSRTPRIRLVQMTPYHEDFELPVLFPTVEPEQVLGAVLAHHGVPNFRLAESEKYAHVTYFFNGGRERPFPCEERLLVPSPKVATYDLQPEMSALEVTRAALDVITRGEHGCLILNFANPDMVGHTGSIEAATAACACIDKYLGRVLEALRRAGWTALVTADHGNAECLIDPVGGGPHTAHTTNPVPCWLVGSGGRLRDGGGLKDVAPTLLGLLGLPVPASMTGADLRKS